MSAGDAAADCPHGSQGHGERSAQRGLFAATAGAIIYTVFGTARRVSTGPSFVLAALAVSAVARAAVSGDDAMALVVAITRIPVLGRQPGTEVFRSIERYPDGLTYPGLLVIRFDGGLFFASADVLGDRLCELAQQPTADYDTVVVSFEGVAFIDSQGSAKVRQVLERARTYRWQLRLARVKPEVADALARAGEIDELGEQNPFGNVHQACADHMPTDPPGDRPDAPRRRPERGAARP